MVRALVILFGLAACASREPPPRTSSPTRFTPDAARTHVVVEPGPRLPDDVTPLGYELRLELDPETDRFRGEVRIRARVTRPIDHVWLHMVGLDIETATWSRETQRTPLGLTTLAGDEMRAFALGQTLGPGDVTLELAYSGVIGHEDEGLFRQRDRDRWYVFSQAESLFARRILPCFDEPRWKVPWTVTLVSPPKLVALANAAQVAERVLPDGRREVRFAPTPPMPSYLLAVAVGPFAIVEAGTVGRARVPLRVVVASPDAQRAGIAAVYSARLVDYLERYFDSPVPWPKLDLVAVPRFFGAMENPGLITFDRGILVGPTTDRGLAGRFARTAGHELAHLWFGDWVTFASWDDLWLAEAFASWMADKLAIEVQAFEDVPYALAAARQRALAADDEPEARPLRRPLARSHDAEDDFDAIAYEKGAAVLTMFEHFTGDAVFRAAIRRYIDEHRDGTATSADLIAAFEREAGPATARALASFLDRAGAPVVDLGVRCERGPPRVEATTRGSIVPVCVRYPTTAAGEARACALVGARTEIPLPGAPTCPAWVVGNAGGTGYYHVTSRDLAPLAVLGPAERIARGDDLAAGLAHGDIALPDALDALARLAASGDAYGRLGGLAIARAIDPLVEDAARVRWSAWLGARFAGALTLDVAARASVPEHALRDGLFELGATPPAAAVARARKQLEVALRDLTKPSRIARLLTFVGPSGGRPVFDQLAGALPRASGFARDLLLDAAATLGPDLAKPIVELALAQTPVAVAGLTGLFERGATRLAAWRVVRPHAAELAGKLPAPEFVELVALTGGVCDAATRAELATTLAPLVRELVGGRRTLDRALARIDRCVARRARIGDVASKLKG